MKEYWRKPQLNVAGQSAFWDAQAAIYEGADMTVDNCQEMDVVIEQCREIPCSEIVTLGGAVGCRDPKMILEKLFPMSSSWRSWPRVVFNDLSFQQVEWAKGKVLKTYEDAGLKVTYFPGEIKNVCRNIGIRNPRRLIIGVYDCGSFFEAHPADGYPLCGYDEYLKNCEILGHEFLIDWMRYTPKGNLVSCGVRSEIGSSDSLEDQEAVKTVLQIIYHGTNNGGFKDVIGLQIIGRSPNRNGFFLSHWYKSSGFKRMLVDVFPVDSFSIKEFHFAKGMVFVVDPVGREPRGVITVLNNVIGNVLPQSQFETLSAIREIIS